MGNHASGLPTNKAPLKGLEPLHLAPEASALSSELQGPRVRETTQDGNTGQHSIQRPLQLML